MITDSNTGRKTTRWPRFVALAIVVLTLFANPVLARPGGQADVTESARWACTI